MKRNNLLLIIMSMFLCSCNPKIVESLSLSDTNSSDGSIVDEQDNNEHTFLLDINCCIGFITDSQNNDYYLKQTLDHCSLNQIYIDGFDSLENQGIEVNDLILGEQLKITVTGGDGSGNQTAMILNNELYLNGEFKSVEIIKANVVELHFDYIENETDVYFSSTNGNNDLTYKLKYNYYKKQGGVMTYPAFTSTDLRGYEVFNEQSKDTVLYGTYIEDRIQGNICSIYGIYLFNPYL